LNLVREFEGVVGLSSHKHESTIFLMGWLDLQ